MNTVAATLWLLGTAILQQCLCATQDMARFVRKPTTKVILPNEIATFDCSVVGMGLLYLNGHILSDSFDELALKGLRYSIAETSDGLRTFTSMKLTVEGLPANNGSLIDCYGYNENVIHSSSLLIIAGPPLAPDPQLLVLNSTSLLLSWLKPFVWDQLADVHTYTVTMYNSSSGEWKEWAVEPSKYNNTNSLVISTTAAEKCIELTFVVSASNKIGESQNKSISGGLPIDMKWNKKPITATVQPHPLDMDSGADVTVQIQPPQMCTYQRADYTVVISNLKSGKKVAEATLHFNSGGEKHMELQFPVAMSDLQDPLFVAEVNVTSMGANNQLLKSTQLSIPFSVGDHSVAEADDTNKSLLIGVAMAATFSLVLLLVLATVAGVECKRRQLLTRKCSSSYVRFSNVNADADDQFSTCT